MTSGGRIAHPDYVLIGNKRGTSLRCPNLGRWVRTRNELGTLTHAPTTSRGAASGGPCRQTAGACSCAWEVRRPERHERPERRVPLAPADMPGCRNHASGRASTADPALGAFRRAGLRQHIPGQQPSPTSTSPVPTLLGRTMYRRVRLVGPTPATDRRGGRPSPPPNGGGDVNHHAWWVLLTSRGAAMCRGWNRARVLVFPTISRMPERRQGVPGVRSGEAVPHGGNRLYGPRPQRER